MTAINRISFYIAVSLIPIATASAQPTLEAPSGNTTLETRLGAFDLSVGNSVFSLDGRHIAFIAENDTSQFVVVDGKPGPAYQFVGQGSVGFSPDGTRVAYNVSTGTKQMVVLDGVAGPQYDGIAGLQFSADGKHLAYGFRSGSKWSLTVDGHSGAEFDAIMRGSIVFSPDGRQLAYCAKNGTDYFVVVNGKPSEPYEKVSSLAFLVTPNGTQPIYFAQRKQVMSLIGSPQPVAQGDHASELVIGPDHKHFAYLATSLDPGTKKVNCFVVRDGQASAPFDAAHTLNDPALMVLPKYSPDGAHLAYVAVNNNKQSVVLDDKPGPAYGVILDGTLTFSPDSNHLAYAAQTGPGTCCVILDGRAGPNFRLVVNDPVTFSPDGKRLAYVATNDISKYFAVVDGQAGPQYDQILRHSLAFSPDAKSVAYSAKAGTNGLVVVNGQAGPKYESICDYSPTFNSDGSLDYLAVRDKTLYRVHCSPAH
jgi:Tol biopolymer transport system component